IACGPPIAAMMSGMVMKGPTPIMSIMATVVAPNRVTWRSSCGWVDVPTPSPGISICIWTFGFKSAAYGRGYPGYRGSSVNIITQITKSQYYLNEDMSRRRTKIKVPRLATLARDDKPTIGRRRSRLRRYFRGCARAERAAEDRFYTVRGIARDPS